MNEMTNSLISDKLVIITLIDFSNHSHDDEHLNFLYSSLQRKLGKEESVPFSLNFNSIGKIVTPSSYYSFDIKILYNYKVILVGGTKDQNPVQLHVLDIDTREIKKTINLQQIKRMHGFCVETENGVDYIYIAGYTLHKLNLTKLMEGKPSKQCCVWKMRETLNNGWGVAVFKSHVYVCDSGRGLFQFDKKNGSKISVIPTRNVYTFGIAFTPENEMLLTYCSYGNTTCGLEIRKLENDKWVVDKYLPGINNDHQIFGEPCNLFYEECSGFIYVTDCTKGRVIVINKKTMQVVKIGENIGKHNNYGIVIDRRNGTMFVCSSNGCELQMFR